MAVVRRATVIIGLEHKVRSFDNALDLYIRAGNPQELKVFHRENRILAYQICKPAGRQGTPRCIQPHDKRDGALHLRTLSMKITQNIVDRIAVSHERFSKLQICRSTGCLALAQRQWKEDLNELQAAGSAPSQATIASSLRVIIGRISELTNTMEIADIMAVRDVRRLYRAVSKRATR